MSNVKQPTETVPNHMTPDNGWYGLLASVVGAEGNQDRPVIA
jgi:hypothetical protein